MTTIEKQELKVEKLNWRQEMRNFFGSTWTKRTACRKTKNGTYRMNTSNN